MKQRIAGFWLAAAVAGCGPKHATFVNVDDVALGRVVIYRNGVAFYERRATVDGGFLTVTVPRERVDDFLKSLTVVDARSRQPLPVSIPRQQIGDGTSLVMTLQLPSTDTTEVVLTYVTEAPAWKPSYRVVVGDKRDVTFEGWAIVDNTSGEDWNNVLVGVGSSSALSFRYDLWSVRQIQRETLANEERFAIAPPTGVSPYGGTGPGGGGGGGGGGGAGSAGGDVILSELRDDEIRRPAGHPGAAEAKPVSDEELAQLESRAEVISVTGSVIPRRELTTPSPVSVIDSESLATDPGSSVLPPLRPEPAKSPEPSPPRGKAAPRPPARPRASPGIASGDQKMQQLSQSVVRSDQTIVIESYASAADTEASRRASDRANIVRNQLIDQGVAPARIKIVPKVDASQPERVRLVAQVAPSDGRPGPGGARQDVDAQPVGESHFANPRPMTVARGSSAMVSMVRSHTEGEVVYLYDAESERGNARFAFRAVRFKNPTDSTLETGPVTVYGHERFIGEGLTEAVPPKASAVVPYALDRQIVIDRNDGEDDRISRLLTLSRGILTAEIQHVRRRRLTVTNRLDEKAKLFVRHTMTKGWTIVEAPPGFERIGDAHLFEVHLAAREVKEIVIAEATPIERTLDLGADVTLEMMKLWVEAPDGAPELKAQLRTVLAAHRALIDLVQAQRSLRRRLAEYRGRSDELHKQIFTLQAVKTGGDLLAHLRAKMKEMSDRVQKTTIQIVDQEQKIMLARVQFQDKLAELTLPDERSGGDAAKH